VAGVHGQVGSARGNQAAGQHVGPAPAAARPVPARVTGLATRGEHVGHAYSVGAATVRRQAPAPARRWSHLQLLAFSHGVRRITESGRSVTSTVRVWPGWLLQIRAGPSTGCVAGSGAAGWRRGPEL